MRISDWSSDVCSSDLLATGAVHCNETVFQIEIGIGAHRLDERARQQLLQHIVLEPLSGAATELAAFTGFDFGGFFVGGLLTTALGRIFSSPPRQIQMQSPTRCESTPSSRPNGEMKPRGDRKERPTSE